MKRARLAPALIALSLITFFAGEAAAQSKSWTAARAVLPGDLMLVGGGNIATVQKTALYQQVVPGLIASEAEAGAVIGMAKSGCAIDVHALVGDVTMAVDEDEHALIVVSLRGTSQAKLLACFQKLARQHGHKGKVTARKTGRIVEYSMAGERDKVYAAWLAADVVAFSNVPDDKAVLAKMIGGKGPKGTVAAALGNVNTGAAFWAVYGKAARIDTGMNLKVGYGNVELAGGKVLIDARIVLASAKEAADCVAKTNQEIAKAQASGDIPAQLSAVIKAVKLTAAGDEVQVKASLSEQDLMMVLGMMMQGGF
jgi:hypothetical protein